MHTNRLANQKSPYLLQHAHNPVNWQPWDDEAFAEAKAQGRPVFLSVGYATCHWCHVMERECFEDDEVAGVLNAGFVSVKVDREERPDVDQVYMKVCHMVTGRGGWPLTALLTPAGEPFYVATYLPKAGLLAVLSSALRLWNENPDKVTASAKYLLDNIKASEASREREPGLGAVNAVRAGKELSRRFDEKFGGFGEAPKFPTPHQLVFMLGQKEEAHRAMALKTLVAMRLGGLWDHVGGGFHRYSTDREWLVPHFEKMLYDQAGLALAYLRAWELTQNPFFAHTLRGILAFVERELSDPLGGFWCGLDADSEGEEGKFYLWSQSEILEVLGADAPAFCTAFNIRPQGNYRDEFTREYTGRCIPHLSLTPGFFAPEGDHSKQLGLLLTARGRRVRPRTDDKVLAGWTAHMASAFALAGAKLGEPAYVDRAKKALAFAFERLVGEDFGVLRRYRDGEAAITGFAEDYAYLGRACLSLYFATFDPGYIDKAKGLTQKLVAGFVNDSGGLNDAPKGSALVMAPREITDGAMPSATSVALGNFLALHDFTGEEEYQELARRLLQSCEPLLSQYPTAFTNLLTNASPLFEGHGVLRVFGPRGDALTEELLKAAQKAFAPGITIIHEPNGEPQAVLCRGNVCGAPMRTGGELVASISI